MDLDIKVPSMWFLYRESIGSVFYTSISYSIGLDRQAEGISEILGKELRDVALHVLSEREAEG